MSGSRGFTLIELVIAMTILAMISLSLAGVISLGSRSASIGERKTEQARRFRVATSIIVRQIRSTAPYEVPTDDDDEPEPYFIGERARLGFVTTLPQSPNDTGLAVVSYWQEDDMLMMSELPYFAAFSGDRLDDQTEHLIFSTPLLYNVRDVRFSYRRSDFAEATWSDSWDAIDEDSLPAAVRIEVEPSTPDGPAWYHEVPIFVGVLNEITGEDDFSRRRSR